jgi:hypothetical protein
MEPVHGFMAVLALGCWVATARKLVDLRRNPSQTVLRYMCVAQASLSVAISVQTFLPFFDRAFGMLDASRVTSNSLTLLSAASGLACGYYSAYPEEVARPLARRCMWWTAAAVASIVGLYALVGPPYALTDPEVTGAHYYTVTPSLEQVPYTIVYLGFLSWALMAICLVAHRHRASTWDCPPLVDLGVRTLMVGANLGLAYSVAKGTAAVLATWDRSWRVADIAVPVFFSGAILAVLVGLAMPWVGERVGAYRLHDRLVARRSCRLLRPLWQLLYEAAPQIALLPHPSSPRLRRVRLTVEILDGYAALGPWMTRASTQAASQHAAEHHLDPEARVAATEAAALATATRRKLDGEDPAAAGSVAIGQASIATSAAEQVDWLERVALALTTSPAVAATLRELALVPEPVGVPAAGR